MSAPAQDFENRAGAYLKWLGAQPLLCTAAQAEVDEFFRRNPEHARTELFAGVIASLVIERLSAGADSQSAEAQPEPQTVA